jgi:hypothetical protein
LKFEHFLLKILIIEVEESGVASRLYFLWGCAFAPLGARTGRARQEGCGEECRAALLIFSRGGMEWTLEQL